jgi:hypothetical protein
MRKYLLIAALGLSTIAVTATVMHNGKKKPAKEQIKTEKKATKSECGSKRLYTFCN